MKKLHGFDRKFYLLIVAVVLIGLGFYWFQWRPSEIKHECSQKISTALKKISEVTFQDMNSAYEFCLHNKGL